MTPAEWHAFQHRLALADFWHLTTNPPIDPDDPFGTEDGAELILEGVTRGQYRLVIRASPAAGPYLDLCGSMLLDLSGIEVRRIWREYHE